MGYLTAIQNWEKIETLLHIDSATRNERQFIDFNVPS